MKYYVIGGYHEYDAPEVFEFDNQQKALDKIVELDNFLMIIEGRERDIKKVTEVTKWKFK